MPCLTPYRGDTSQMLLFKIASCLEASGPGGGGVLSFNGRTGNVILSLADVASVADGRYVLKTGDTMTGALVHPDGTAALPSITFTGDLDTGIYHPAANAVGLTAGGAIVFSALTTGVNIPSGLAYQYNSVNVIRAQTALNNYFFGPSGNLTMTGVQNSAIGFGVLSANTTGSDNVANGYRALFSNTTGKENVANGSQALFSNTTGIRNLASGFSALFSNTTGENNVANGFRSLFSNTTGNENVANGEQTLFSNTTGTRNVANGQQTLFSNTTGSFNTGSGGQALFSNTTGSNNVAIGYRALFDLTTPATGQNTVIGYNTGLGITTGDNNTILGANVTGLAAGLSNNIILADGAGVIRLQVASTGVVTIPIALTLSTAAPLSMASGANQRAGDVVLVAGTVTTANTTVTANTRVYTSRKTAGGVLGNLTYTLIAATSFTITSDNIADTSTVSYLLIEVP